MTPTREYRDVKICPSCQHLNAPDQMRCVNCKAILPVTTTRVTIEEQKLDHNIPTIQPVPGKVILYIPGERAPIMVPAQSRMLIGRAQVDGSPVAIDLGPFDAQNLGVSRTHAAITFTETSVFVEDLASSNGTWLNENRLQPLKPYALRSGDLARFANLIVFIYFSDDHATKSSFKLVARGTPLNVERQGLNLVYFKSKFLPYLEALVTLQLQYNEAMGDPTAEVSLSSFQLAEDKRGVQVTLYGVSKIVEFIATKLSKVKFPETKPISLPPYDPNSGTTLITEGSPVDKTPSADQELSPEILDLIDQLVDGLLAHSALAEDKKRHYSGLANALLGEISEMKRLMSAEQRIPPDQYHFLELLLEDLLEEASLDQDKKKRYIDLCLPNLFVLLTSKLDLTI